MRLPDILILSLCLAGAIPRGRNVASAQVPASPVPASQAPASKTPPKPTKKPAEPVDPDATAGVRGAGYSIMVEVQFKRKPVDSAYVLVKNPDGTVAGTCSTDSTGCCTLSIGAGDYTVTATQNRLKGEAATRVTSASKLVVIKLTQIASEDSTDKH